jgi:hypothetical protein
MSLRCFWLLLLLGGADVGAAGDTAAPPAGQLIGHAWAGHPVSFALLTAGGRQFVAYYDGERRLTVAQRRLGDHQWTTMQPAGRWLPKRRHQSNVTGWDSHNYLTLAVDRDGCLHLAGNMHVDPLIYYRSRQPYDITTFERLDRMTGDRETACTYPVFFKNAAGDLLFRYRDGLSGNGGDLYNCYDPATRTWHRLLDSPVLEGEGRRNAYALDPVLGPDGRFHLVWMWRDSPDCSTNHVLSYARSSDLIHWEDHRGAEIPLPITLLRGDIVDAAAPGRGLINMTFNLGFDSAQRPVIVYHRYDDDDCSQIYAARPDGDHWVTRAISAWDFHWGFGGTGSVKAEVLVGRPRLDADGSLLVPFSSVAAGAGRWRLRAEDLAPIEQLPAGPALLPARLLGPLGSYPGLEVNLQVNRAGGVCHVLRWETLPRNRDFPRTEFPPPTELRLFEVPDTGGEFLQPVGS